MPASISSANASLEVVFSGRASQLIELKEFPFYIGRGQGSGNQLALDDMRISRNCAVITAEGSAFLLQDRGQREGIFVNGLQATLHPLNNGDRIRLGNDEGCQLIFRLPSEQATQEEAESKLRSILGSIGSDSGDELKGLKLLLEATSLMHSQLPLESVLSTMLDHAIAITRADRGMLLEPDDAGVLQVRVARGQGRQSLPPEQMHPSRSVLASAVETQAAVVNEDLNLAEMNLQSAQSVVVQLLRSSVVIPLYCVAIGNTSAAKQSAPRQLLGAVYLDSRRTATFSKLDRQILEALGAQAGSILEHAQLIERERERQRLEQELSIAREIQQALLPHGLQDYPHYSITGLHRPCNEVGGDYFDVFPLADGRLALVIADVAGKGLGAALVTTMLQGALSGMNLGVEPVTVFNQMNRFLCSRASVGRCATIFFGLLSADGTLEFVSAGHPSPLLMRRGVVSELYSEGSLPVGLLDEAAYDASRIQLEQDDTLLLYTDGITETEDKQRNLFQDVRLKEVFAQHRASSLEAMLKAVLRDVEGFADGASQSDDLTLLVLRYRGRANADQI
jgi:serine phosphatase RsbU (regulator of sigma subunit)/pSer/pThr/pTyr-binding forkhead associated (FHA) protein